jgi:type II secretory pathway pseudopilin PulG
MTPGGQMPAAALPQETSGKAIASLVFGLFIFAFPLSILAVIFGHLSLSEIRKSAGRLKGQGMAIAGLVLGYAGLAAIPLLLILAAIAIPTLLRARMAANESAATASVRALITAETRYSESHREAGYTCALSDLAGAGLIDERLASGQKTGYTFELKGCSASADGGPNVKFQVLAYPLTLHTTGTRAFCSNETGAVKTVENGSPEGCLDNGAPL